MILELHADKEDVIEHLNSLFPNGWHNDLTIGYKDGITTIIDTNDSELIEVIKGYYQWTEISAINWQTIRATKLGYKFIGK